MKQLKIEEIGVLPWLLSRSRKVSEVFGLIRIRIPKKTRNPQNIFL